jgi:salicylate hydroxylase
VALRRRCVGVAEYPDRVELHFADGSATGADLVLGADGLHSVIRAVLATDPVRHSGLTVHRGLIHTVRVPELGPEPAVRVWLGRGRHVVCYPISARWVNVVAVLPDGIPDPVTGFPHPPEPLRSVLRAARRTTPWPLADRAPLDRWCTARVALLGDAAHPLLPFAAQGANQAVEDAATLAACLRAAPPGPAGIAEALRRYQRIRIPRLARVAALVHENTAGDRVTGDRTWLYNYDAESAYDAEPEGNTEEETHYGDPTDPALPDADRGGAGGQRTVLAAGPGPGAAADP